MFNEKYCILSFNKKNKHYVLRTSEEDENIILNIDGVMINSSIAAIADCYKEACTILDNLTRRVCYE